MSSLVVLADRTISVKDRTFRRIVACASTTADDEVRARLADAEALQCLWPDRLDEPYRRATVASFVAGARQLRGTLAPAPGLRGELAAHQIDDVVAALTERYLT